MVGCCDQRGHDRGWPTGGQTPGADLHLGELEDITGYVATLKKAGIAPNYSIDARGRRSLERFFPIFKAAPIPPDLSIEPSDELLIGVPPMTLAA